MLRYILNFVFLISFTYLSALTFTTTGNSTDMTDPNAWTCNCNPMASTLKYGGGHVVNIDHSLIGGDFSLLGGNIVVNVNATFSPDKVVLGGYQRKTITGTSMTVSTSFEVVSGHSFSNKHRVDIELNANELILGSAGVNFKKDVNVNSIDAGGTGGSSVVTFNGDLTTNGGDADFSNASSVTLNGTTSLGDLTIEGSASLDINGPTTAGVVTIDGGNTIIEGTSTLAYTSISYTSGTICGYSSPADVALLITPIDFSDCPGSILPIELNYFTVVQTIEGFQFEWQTLTELNNDYFIIEYSRDLKNYTELVTVEGSGSSLDAIDYEYFSDDLFVNPEDEVIYFRLKQVDFDESFSYSLVVPVTLEKRLELGFSVYPNPATNNVIVNIPMNLSENELVEVSLMNLLSTNTEVLNIETGEESNIDVAHLPSGLYLVRVEGVTNPVKLVIQ